MDDVEGMEDMEGMEGMEGMEDMEDMEGMDEANVEGDDGDDGDEEDGEDGESEDGGDDNGDDENGGDDGEMGSMGADNHSSLLNIGGDEDDNGEEHVIKKSDTSHLNRQEKNVMKRKELTTIERLEKKGYKPCKKFTMVDKLDEIIAERERLEDEKGCDESVKWQRKIIMGTSTGIEYLNKVYDPFDLKLEGWSESIYENIADYDEVFEELYHKYKNKVKVAPEIKLIGMFAGSALMFHFSKTLFSKASDQVPGFDSVMRDNPEIKAAYEQAALKKMNMNGNQANNPTSSMIGNFFGNPMLGNMLGGLMGQNQPTPPQRQPQSPPQPHVAQQTDQPQPSTNIVIPKTAHIPTSQPKKSINIDIDGPSGVDELLNSLTKGTNNDLAELQMSDVGTTGTLSDIGSNVKNVSYHNKRTTKSGTQKNKVNLKLL
jgi:hypothetical protein